MTGNHAEAEQIVAALFTPPARTGFLTCRHT
jgi:hypothetical protein